MEIVVLVAAVFVAVTVNGIRRSNRTIQRAFTPTLRPAVLYDQDAEPSPLELAQVVAEATDIARQAAT